MEHLVRIKLASADDFIDFYRDIETGKISLCSKEHCASLPELTGLETTELFALLEPLGEKIEVPADELADQIVDEEGMNEPEQNQ
ncbi:hypothetical protein KKF82_08405 [Patescibacteria group bacterium]|nr:hypothetical protein [Patescibacteria group bacterium]